MTSQNPNEIKTPKTASSKSAVTSNKIPAKKKKGNVFFSGLKNFGIVFVLCLVVFGLLASLAVTFVTSAVDDIFEEKTQLEEILNKDAEETAAPGSDTPLPEGESFTVFIAVTDFDPAHYNYYPHGSDLAEMRLRSSDRDLGILSAGYKTVQTKLNVIVRFDKERREYTVTPVSSHTKVFTPSGYVQLGDVYHSYGPEYLVEKVEAITGLGIDYYMFFNALEAPKIISALGTFNVEISKDIYSDGAAFGTAEKAYGDVTTVIPPETIPAEPKKVVKKSKSSDTGDTEDVTDTEQVTTEQTTEEQTTEDTEKADDGREEYHRVVSAGTVTVNANNIRALLMFDDCDGGGTNERLELEYQLVRGALLSLASMSDDERMKFYDSVMLETTAENCSVTYVSPEEGDDDDDDTDADESKKNADPAGYGTFSDGRINTDISRKTAQLKGEMIAAAMRFTVKHLEFDGRYVNGFFSADMAGNASRFMPYKLPSDPEKIVTVKS